MVEQINRRDIIAIGGSWGAVEAVKGLCRGLPGDFPGTLLIAIHVGARGHDLLAEIFAEEAGIAVTTAQEGEILRPNHAYVAPADHHLLVVENRIRLGRGPRENMARPAIDPLLRSVAICCGFRAIGVILTGMLNDGAAGLADLKRCGGITVVQNPHDAVAPDMPWEALKASEVDYRAGLKDLPALLVELSRQEAGSPMDCPKTIHTEVEIALGKAERQTLPDDFADLTSLSCPACGGVLSQIRQGPPLRFRCQVGHAYTAEALALKKEGAIDEALRVALRILEERVTLTRKMAEEARRSGRLAAALSYEGKLVETEDQAEKLRLAIEQL